MGRRGFIATLLGAVALPKLLSKKTDTITLRPLPADFYAVGSDVAAPGRDVVAYNLYGSGNGKDYHLIDSVPADRFGNQTRPFNTAPKDRPDWYRITTG